MEVFRLVSFCFSFLITCARTGPSIRCLRRPINSLLQLALLAAPNTLSTRTNVVEDVNVAGGFLNVFCCSACCCGAAGDCGGGGGFVVVVVIIVVLVLVVV